MRIHAYLNLPGTCREVFAYYVKALGGKIASIQTFGGSPVAEHVPPETHRLKDRFGIPWMVTCEAVT